VSFAAITLCVACQRVFIFVSVYFVTDPVRKLLDITSYSNGSYGKRVGKCGLDASDSEYRPAAGSCEHGNEHSGSMKGG
jgi:hypothetical protein